MKSPQVRPGLTPALLAQQITDFVTERTEAVVKRFAPGFAIPAIFCGHRRPGFSEAPDFLFVLGYLHKLGVNEVAGMPVRDAMIKLLHYVDGPATNTFYSYRVAETLLAFGKFEGNPLLEGFSDAERENLRVAVDSTSIYDPVNDTLGKILANNFWAVLARCEFARQELGLLEDDKILRRCVDHVNHWLFQNPGGYFDDGHEANGRYDIYSGDSHLFAEPIWHLLDPKKLDFNLRQHVQLLEKITMENGASFVYGRSVGALSLCLMMEITAVGLAHGMAADPARSLSLIAHSLDCFRGWIEDDLINAHRHGNTEGYRGIHRVLQMTIDCLGKLAYTALKLRDAAPAPAAEKSGDLFPLTDELIPYDARGAGVWMFRNDHLAFQLAVVGGHSADYVAIPRSPGLFGNPVGGQMLCGVPRIVKGTAEFSAYGLPAHVEKFPNSISLTHENFINTTEEKAPTFPGRRVVNYRIDDDTITVEEHLTFAEAPDAIAYNFPETAIPLHIEVSSSQPIHQDKIVTTGMHEWRSAWEEFKALHQVQVTPATDIRITFRIRPKIRVRHIPATNHDYMRALSEAMPTDTFVEKSWDQNLGMDLAAMTADVDILHLSWPEHLFGNPPPEEWAEFDARNLSFIEQLGRTGVRIVWTMHNRRPHNWTEERGRKLYEAWARISDGVIHHSEWAMKIARAELPYRPDAQHAVIPHGHFGAQRIATRTREEVERALNLPPCTMRFGMTGRWQKDKQVELIMEAFTKAAKPGQQLVLTSYTPEMTKPEDPHIIFLPRERWMTAQQVAEYTLICDALVSAHGPSASYFTSGLPADAIGAGIPVLAPKWDYFREILGDAAFYHDNTLDGLAALFASITPDDLARGKAAFTALQPKFAWPAIAEKTLALYRSVGRPLSRIP